MSDKIRALVERHPWLAPVAGALFVRLLLVAVLPMYPRGGDTLSYQAGGESLARGLGYTLDGVPITWYMPGYSLVLGAIYKIVGIHPGVVRVVQAFVGAGSALLAFAVAARVAGRRASARAGLVAAWAVALYPAYVFYTGALLTETLGVFLVLLAGWLALRVTDEEEPGGRRRWLLAATLGLTLGALLYVKVELAYLPTALAGFSLLRPRLRPRFGHLAVAAALAYACLGPWIARNWIDFHAFMPLKDNGGRLLWSTTHAPPYLENAPQDPEWRAAYERLTVPGHPVETDKNFRREALVNLRAHPGSYAKWCVRRGVSLFFMSHTDAFEPLDTSYATLRATGQWGRLAVKLALFAVQIAAVLVGLWALWRSRAHGGLWALRLHFLLTTTIYVLLYGTVRYSMVLMPTLFVGLGVTLAMRRATVDEAAAPVTTAAA